MKNRISYTVESRRDMDDIWDYIAYDLQNVPAAERTVGKIMDAVDQLEIFAESGAPLASVSDANSDERFLVSGSYLIFYHVNGSDVFIDRVLYGRRDYLRVLFGDSIKEETE